MNNNLLSIIWCTLARSCSNIMTAASRHRCAIGLTSASQVASMATMAAFPGCHNDHPQVPPSSQSIRRNSILSPANPIHRTEKQSISGIYLPTSGISFSNRSRECGRREILARYSTSYYYHSWDGGVSIDKVRAGDLAVTCFNALGIPLERVRVVPDTGSWISNCLIPQQLFEVNRHVSKQFVPVLDSIVGYVKRSSPSGDVKPSDRLYLPACISLAERKTKKL